MEFKTDAVNLIVRTEYDQWNFPFVQSFIFQINANIFRTQLPNLPLAYVHLFLFVRYACICSKEKYQMKFDSIHPHDFLEGSSNRLKTIFKLVKQKQTERCHQIYLTIYLQLILFITTKKNHPKILIRMKKVQIHTIKWYILSHLLCIYTFNVKKKQMMRAYLCIL